MVPRVAASFSAVLGLLACGDASAFCGKDVAGCRPGGTSCPASTGDLHLQLDETLGEPCNDEAAALFVITLGSAAGPDSADPTRLTLQQTGLYGGALRFVNDAVNGRQFVKIFHGTEPELVASVSIHASFWIRVSALPPPGQVHTILYRGRIAGDATACNSNNDHCRNYEVSLLENGALRFQYHEQNPPNDPLVTCRTDLELIGAPVLVAGAWQHVSIGVARGLVPGGDVFDYQYNGQPFTKNPAACVTDFSPRSAPNVVGSDVYLGSGRGANLTGEPLDISLDLDEVRLDISGGPSAGPPTTTNIGGIAIAQVIHDDPNRFDRVLLYRPYSTGGVNEVDLSGAILADSSSADGDAANLYTFPSGVKLKPGEFAEVVLCNSAGANCAASDVVLSPTAAENCNILYTLNAPAGDTLGDGALSGTDTTGCSATTCLNANDSLVLRTATPKVGLAWGTHATADPAFTDGATGLAPFGAWPTAAGVQVGLAPAADTIGWKLSPSSPANNANTVDSWLAIASTTNYSQLVCQPPGVTGAPGVLRAFEGSGLDRAARLAWETGDETGVRGIRLYRALPGQAFQPVTPELLDVRGSPSGARYEHRDEPLPGGARVWYGLEVIGQDGAVVDSATPIEVQVGMAAGACSCRIAAPDGSLAGAALALAASLARRRPRA